MSVKIILLKYHEIIYIHRLHTAQGIANPTHQHILVNEAISYVFLERLILLCNFLNDKRFEHPVPFHQRPVNKENSRMKRATRFPKQLSFSFMNEEELKKRAHLSKQEHSELIQALAELLMDCAKTEELNKCKDLNSVSTQQTEKGLPSNQTVSLS